MTVATNALLEGRYARTAFVATDGFTDIVELGRQARPHLYRLCEAGPRPLVPPERRFGAAERMGPRGVLRALEREPALRARGGARARRSGRGCGGAAALLRASRARACTGGADLLAPAGRPSFALARARRDLPRVRTRGDHGGRRRTLPARRRLPAQADAGSTLERAPRAADHAVIGRPHRRRASRKPRCAHRALRPRGGRRRRGTPRFAVWRARRPLLRHGRNLVRRTA